MRLQPRDFFDTAITPELIRTTVEPAIEALDLYIASKYARLFINGPVIMAAAVLRGVPVLQARPALRALPSSRPGHLQPVPASMSQ